jgi:sulfofructose kinase
LPNIDYLITSRDCPSRLAGGSDLRVALPLIQQRYGCRLTGATLGEQGVLVWDGRQFHYAPAYVIQPVDTTGAGDTFHAAFIYGFLQGWPLQRQLEFACAAAALNCLGIGARGRIQPVAKIGHFMATSSKHRPAFTV